MINLNIRKARVEDISEIMCLYHSLIGTNGCTWSEDYPTLYDVESDLAKSSLYVLCDENNKILGVAAAGEDTELEHLKCWSRDIKRVCDLARIGVRCEYQGEGLGEMLVRYIEKDVVKRDFDGIHFLVSKTNPSALALYDKLNYSNVGEAYIYDVNWYCYEKKLKR